MDESHEQQADPSDLPAPEQRFPCGQCGAKLVFKPGTAVLNCEYCGFENAIPQSEDDIQELDFETHLSALANEADAEEAAIVKCTACAAEFEPPEHATAFACPFCGTDAVATAKSKRLIKPKALLPFHVDRKAAWGAFGGWLRSRWFAPNALKRYARTEERLNGMYVPYWTYDSDTVSHYTGMRGEYYYVEVGTGKNKRRERRIHWYPCSGVVCNSFDDLLVMASHSLPRKYAERLEPWDLPNLVSYSDEYLSGFQAERYQVDLFQGFLAAQQMMQPTIEAAVRRDIGGDVQQITSLKTQYNNVTFKHILLPVWISAYRYKEKTFRFLVNARTGEVQGERPWSWIKITLFSLAMAAIAAGIWYLWAG